MFKQATIRLGIAGALCVMCLTSGVMAQSSAAADALFEQGRQAFAAGDYETACGRFRESDRLDPAPGTKLNLARCEEKRGRLVTAWELFRECIPQLAPEDDRLPLAKQSVTDLDKRIPRLTLRLAAGAPATTKVSDGTVAFESGSFGVALPRDPGKLKLEVSAPGHASRTISVTLVERQKLEVEVSPGNALGSATSTSAVGPSRGGNTRTIGYVLGGVGAAGIVIGGVTTAILLGKKSTASSHCNDTTRTCDQQGVDANDSGRALAPISTVAWIVGLAGLGAGAYLVLSSKESPQTQVGAHVAATGGRLSLSTQW